MKKLSLILVGAIVLSIGIATVKHISVYNNINQALIGGEK